MSCCPCRKNSRKKITTDKEWSCTCDCHKTPYHVEQLALISDDDAETLALAAMLGSGGTYQSIATCVKTYCDTRGIPFAVQRHEVFNAVMAKIQGYYKHDYSKMANVWMKASGLV